MVDFEKRCSYLEGELRHINERILNWIREHEFTQHQGGYQLHADDMEEYVKKLFVLHAVRETGGKDERN